MTDALTRGIIDLVQFQFGKRPLLTREAVQRLVVGRFDWS